MKTANTEVSVTMKFKDQKGFRDSAYRAFVTGKPCIVHGSPGEAHHYGDMTDGRGTGHKATDQNLVPVCQQCHREVEKVGRARFEEKHRVDFDKISETLHRLFNEREYKQWCR